jgi:hypothetical protein
MVSDRVPNPFVSSCIYVDHRQFVWVGGNGPKDHQILKFTKDGKFVMQIGKAG